MIASEIVAQAYDAINARNVDRLLGYVSEEINWARRRRAPLWPRRCRELLAELMDPGA